MGFTNFLCQVISNENTDQNDKLEYIITLIDFLDEGDNIQQSVMDYMYQDKENIFLLSIKDYIQNNFNDFIALFIVLGLEIYIKCNYYLISIIKVEYLFGKILSDIITIISSI